MASEVEIDDSLYSRQRYVLGDGAMQRMAKANVLLYGMGGLGIEIAKNVVLAGIKTLTIQDPITATLSDLGTQFFLREEDVTNNRNRAEASHSPLSELNPYVTINCLTEPLTETSDLQCLKQFQCVVLTELPLSVQIKVNDYCHQNDIKFISADVYGLFCGCFCDFGDNFSIVDPNGEEPKDVMIANITKANPGVVTCLDNRMHGFESDDTVVFKEVGGMTALNGKQFTIKVLSPYAFSIDDTSGAEFDNFTHGGIATQVKLGKTVNFESLKTQMRKPDLLIADFSKFEAPISIHAGFIALNKFKENNKRLPGVWCEKDAEEMCSIVQLMKTEGMFAENGEISSDIIRLISFTSQGAFVPLCASLGGMVAQEVLKAVTAKFTPLHQWLYLDAMDVLNKEDLKQQKLFKIRGDRYDVLRVCVGDNCVKRLQDLKLFMVGCGAIGCEMMKNYALMGIGTGTTGQITITDNDLIEKSNLNRQFLFRPQHIRKSKSVTAAVVVKQINPGMKIIAQQNKVCPQTEDSVYTDQFFEEQNLVVNALDNVEARRYVDSRCVTNQRSLLESGTLGTKGHTQVIVAHVTESYSSQRDPPEEEVPYCTLKSFPANIEHCIQWARDKFQSSFNQKPNLFNKFWQSHADPQQVIDRLQNGDQVEGAVQTSKILNNRPKTWNDCVCIGRLKFEKYFNHRAKLLLNVFPLDTKLNDGSLFWQSPKRPPIPVEFNQDNPLHMQFVEAAAHVYADVNNIPVPSPIVYDELKQILSALKVPEFVPSNKTIEVDVNAKREEESVSSDELVVAAEKIKKAVIETSDKSKALQKMAPAEFEKDDDSNGHIDFISAAANLRGTMYQIENVDRLKIKRIAGRIVPAIATTTAAVSGLISIELVKVVESLPLDRYRNCFLNLALPVMLFSEPGPAEKTVIREDLYFTNWDRWEVQGTPDFTLQDFINYFKTKYSFDVTMVAHGVKMVYVPFMPAHKKRLPEKMTKLLKAKADEKYQDLVVSFESMEDDDIAGPPIRYYLGH